MAMKPAALPPSGYFENAPRESQQPIITAELNWPRAGTADELSSGPGLPEPNGSIPTGAGQQIAAVVEDRMHRLCVVAFQERLLLTRRGIPNVDRVILIAVNGQERPVRVPDNPGPAAVMIEGSDSFACAQVPDLNGLLPAHS